MRRRELQSIQLKLSELKEYDQAKAERAKARQQMRSNTTPPSDNDSDVAQSLSVPSLLLASNSDEDSAPKPPSSSSTPSST